MFLFNKTLRMAGVSRCSCLPCVKSLINVKFLNYLICMKRLIFILLLDSFIINKTIAQIGKYDIAISYGFYTAPNYKNSVSKDFFAADFDYHLTKKWTISSGLLSGRFAYFEDWRSNYFSYDEYTNATGYASHYYLALSRSVSYDNRLFLQMGAGVGLFTERLKYTFEAPTSTGTPRGISIFTAEESFSAFEIPIRVEGFYMLGTRIGVGIKAGTFIQKISTLSGTYIGPQIRVRL
jgi:hypothetical protein